MEKNKKLLLVLGISTAIILLIICCFISTNDEENKLSNDPEVIYNNAKKESNAISDEVKKEFSQINTNTYLEYYNNEEEKLVLIARPSCTYCQIAEPIIQNIAYEYNLDINYLNTDGFSDDDKENLINSDEYFNDEFGTPLLLVVGNGQIVDKVSGLTDRAHYIEFFKTYNFIK